jgi:DNA-binding NarL/FixJ family response regulator
MHTRILILEDNKASRSSLESFLDEIKKYVIVGDCEKRESIAANLNNSETSESVSDLRISKKNTKSFGGIGKMKAEKAFIMYTVFEDEKDQFNFLQWMTKEDLLNHVDFEHLLDIIENANNKGNLQNPSFENKIVSALILRKNYQLSPREKEVLKYLVDGYSYRMIADSIFVSLSTVQAHVKNIYAKLHVNSGIQAVAVAIREHIV